MRNRSTLPLAAIAAIALLVTAVSAASARNLEIPGFTRGFRIVWTHLHLSAAGREADCPVTLEGDFAARTFAKNNLTNLGRVTEAMVGTCTRNTATVLRATLPWEVTYQSFGGSLPNITALTLDLIGASFNVNLEGIQCLARTATSRPARGIAEVTAGRINRFEAESAASIETSGGFLCSFGGPGHFSGSASSITVRGGVEAITVRLI